MRRLTMRKRGKKRRARMFLIKKLLMRMFKSKPN